MSSSGQRVDEEPGNSPVTGRNRVIHGIHRGIERDTHGWKSVPEKLEQWQKAAAVIEIRPDKIACGGSDAYPQFRIADEL